MTYPLNRSCPQFHCRGCSLPLHAMLTRNHGVFPWETQWSYTAGALPQDRAIQSHKATVTLRSFIHSTHNRGPFHWVPFLDMFDWLLLQWNPMTYEKLEALMRRQLFWAFPKFQRLPMVGGFLVRRVAQPRTIFVTIPLLPYLIRYVLRVVSFQGVVLYVGRGWEDAVVPRSWLRTMTAHPRIRHIFAENPQIVHPGVTAMPIGMDPVFLQHPSGQRLLDLAASVPLDRKLLRVAGGWMTAGPARVSATAYIKSKPWCDWIDTSYAGIHGERQMEYWRIVVRYAFILSPSHMYHGMGPLGGLVDTDSYRTMEGLVLRTIPILLDGPNAWPWEGLPVVRVANWSEVTPANMRRWWRERRDLLEGDRPYLRSAYWWRKIEHVVNESWAAEKR